MQEGVTYQFGAAIDPTELAGLFVGTTWADGRSADKIKIMLENSTLHISVWREGKIIGFLRVITDNVYRAVLDDLVVHPNFRKQGIGTEIMRQMMKRLEHLEEISLDCEDELLPYYAKFGFLPDQFNCVRVWRRK